MKVVIIEDELPAAQKLTRTLKEIMPEADISGVIPSVEQAVNFFSQIKDTELIFMDIQLEDGICFEIFERICVDIPIIFTTAFDEYTLKAFKQNSIDYLLKPIKSVELSHAIQKFRKNRKTVPIIDLQQVIKSFTTSAYKERFLIKVGEHYNSIEINSVNCFFIKEGFSFLSTKNKRCYGIDYSLDKIEGLIDPKSFFRINRNYIVRFNAIENILAYSSNRLRIKIKDFEEQEDIVVSRERVKMFKEWMDR